MMQFPLSLMSSFKITMGKKKLNRNCKTKLECQKSSTAWRLTWMDWGEPLLASATFWTQVCQEKSSLLLWRLEKRWQLSLPAQGAAKGYSGRQRHATPLLMCEVRESGVKGSTNFVKPDSWVAFWVPSYWFCLLSCKHIRAKRGWGRELLDRNG